MIADKVIDVAKSQIGYHEKASWADLDDPAANPGSSNYTKYSRDLSEYHYYNSSKKGVAWCDVFVDWCFATAYGPDLGHRMLYQPLRGEGAGCRKSREYFAQKHALVDNPEPGDQVFFRSADGENISHTGLVTKVDGSHVYTIEGNSGDQVKAHKYKRDFGRFAGFGRPNWALADNTQKEDDHPMEPMIVTADSGSTVNVRRSPDKNSPKIAAVKIGTQVQAGPDEDGWRQIAYGNGGIGYMMSEYLIPVGESVPPTVATSTDLPAPQPSGAFINVTMTQADLDKLYQARDLLIQVLGVG